MKTCFLTAIKPLSVSFTFRFNKKAANILNNLLVNIRINFLLSIPPFTYLEPIEKALLAGFLETSLVVDKETVRVILPPLTQELRQEFAHQLSKKAEEAKRTLRKWRDEVWSKVQEATRVGKIREDDKFRAKDELQKIIDEYSQKIDKLKERKLEELEMK